MKLWIATCIYGETFFKKNLKKEKTDLIKQTLFHENCNELRRPLLSPFDSPMFHFYTPCKRQKAKDFLMFSEGT